MPVTENSLFLTFDDGPHPDLTPWVLNLLNEYDAKGTFFCVGNNVIKYSQVYQRAIREGHETGNHTFRHLNGWKTGKAAYLHDVEMCAKEVSSNLFRPPYGKLRQSHYVQLKKKYKVVMWDVLSGDFDKRTMRNKVVSNVINHAKAGSIVVFHDSEKAGEKLMYSLPRILEFFKEKRFRFESLKSINHSVS